jgi:hypothetical protein
MRNLKNILLFIEQTFEGVLVIYNLPSLKNHQENENLPFDVEVLFHSPFNVFFVSDANGNPLRVSPDCERLWGITKKEFLRQTVFEMEKEKVFTLITRMVLKEKPRISTIQKTSTGKTLLVMGIPVKDKVGKIEGSSPHP